MKPLLLPSTTKHLLWGSETWIEHPGLPLLKFIDARDKLSIQVHPNDELARRRHDKNGKTEMWYVVDADPGATLLAGFERPVTPEEYDRRVADGTLHELLRRYEVAAGDVFYLPAGTPHSIGAGIRIAEIQQPSDVTYRISDFGRVDSDGRPRELHTEWAREAMDFSACDAKIAYTPTCDREILLVKSPYFTTSFYRLTRPMTFRPQVPTALMMLSSRDVFYAETPVELPAGLEFLAVKSAP